MSSDRPRPPSVARLLAAARPQVAAETDPDALTAVAREVVADERSRLAAGEPLGDDRAPGRRPPRPARGIHRPGGERPGHGPQRDRGHPPHQPRPRAVAGRGDRRRPGRRGRLLAARARPRRRPSRAALPRRGRPSHRADRRRGRAGHDQQRRGPRAGGRARRPAGRGGVARGAGRDRWRRAHPGDRPARGRAAGRGRHHQPDPRRRLRRAARGRAGRHGPARPPVELRPDRVRRGARSGRGRARRARARGDRRRRPRQRRAARHRRATAWPTSRRPRNGSRRARTS